MLNHDTDSYDLLLESMATHKKTLEDYFRPFRNNVIGQGQCFTGPYGEHEILYADWVASGRLYAPIERAMMDDFGPYVANTHSSSTVTADLMTMAYHEAKHIIKQHVGASYSDVIIPCGPGMTSAVNKLQRILGLRVPERLSSSLCLEQYQRPVIFITHMEHHSNQTSWLETIGEVEIINPDEQGNVDLNHLEQLLKKHAKRPYKIASVTACSNVTGIITPYHAVARLMHKAGGYCFVDFAASAPYVNMNMHPAKESERLDAIFFSPHKFLGGPGSAGILIFDSHLYHNRIPDHPGGGTVTWTNPWGGHRYVSVIEEREDGGTPAFLQTIRAALSIRLKEEMGVKNILAREKECMNILFNRMASLKGVVILEERHRERLGMISFHVEGLYHQLAVKMLNDRYGIQMRGGCDCAGTYGHYLLNISPEKSRRITSKIDKQPTYLKPGWVRLSVHPVMSDDEMHRIADAVEELSRKHSSWKRDYVLDKVHGEYHNTKAAPFAKKLLQSWF